MPTLTQLATWKGYSLEELPKVAAEVAAALPMVGVVAVHGTMGAGKTTLVRAVLQVWGTEEEGASPTFGLVHHHTVSRQGEPCQVRHMDLYRLEHEEEAERAGIADMLLEDVLTLVEWPERVPGLMPDDAHLLQIEELSDGTRQCILSALRG
ncbi:MAG: tRNA (adenosine(37)-N6)-threonylcarbamoyltransferase complex ATPase subunit type 1 TsaE [Flavobacteriales bacterium]